MPKRTNDPEIDPKEGEKALSEAEAVGGVPQHGEVLDIAGEKQTPAADPAPKQVDVTIGGQTLTVAPEMAAALEAQKEEYSSQLETRDREIESLRPVKTPDPEAGPNYDEDLFADPSGTLASFGEKLRADIIKEVTGMYIKDKTEGQFWINFYKANPELQEHDFLVKATLAEKWDELGTMKGDKAIGVLADATKSHILSLTDKQRGRGPVDRTTTLEGGSPPTPSPSREQPAAPEGPVSLAAAIRDRNKTRREPRKRAS